MQKNCRGLFAMTCLACREDELPGEGAWTQNPGGCQYSMQYNYRLWAIKCKYAENSTICVKFRVDLNCELECDENRF